MNPEKIDRRIGSILARHPGMSSWAVSYTHLDVYKRQVLGFQNREDADRFLKELQERVRKFGLELHPDKTRLIEFGRYAAERRKKRGKESRKPSIFWVSHTSVGAAGKGISR